MVSIYIEKEDKYTNIKFNGKLKSLLKKLNINNETVLVTKNKELLTVEDSVKNTDSIEIRSVVSGG
ncbi:thiamine biosynthesis protein ThiS [Candidatus Woesearchaeota archaeon CG10_big_fil_rev_8_21_14_0_10_34_8]|nr:MAG: thiamine biosynthesis protein ThiS [Candidatus Woesearchaeota archaeon CG10_big_fil_rev_8_21_14_0_10_34_8]